MNGGLTQPTVRQRRVAAEIRMLRNEHGMSITDIAGILNCDPALVEDYEMCRTRVSWLVMRLLMEELHVPHDRCNYILALMVKADQPQDDRSGWDQLFWTQLVQTAPPWKRMYVGLNYTACTKRMFHPSLLPSVLQTDDYATGLAQHVLRAGKPELKQAVQQRVQRASRISDPDNPLTAHAIFTEAALRTQVGGRHTMRAQYRRLLALAELPNVTMQVVPFDYPISVAFNPFVMLGYPEPVGNAGVVYLEHLTRTTFIDNADEIADYEMAWSKLASGALPPDESVRFIAAVRDQD